MIQGAQFETPITFFVFNRPDATSKVFAEITAIKPKHLLLIADGPRSAEEEKKCTLVRQIVSRIDWPCKVQIDFSENNLGCRERVSSGLKKAFSLYEEAIILEDDCLPSKSFFQYCSDLLLKYRNEDKIMMICGSSFLQEEIPYPYSYGFSKYPIPWGWASWRRAWGFYDVGMVDWPDLRNTDLLRDYLGSHKSAHYFTDVFDATFEKKIDTWDYQWMLACWKRRGMVIIPHRNLISNIGFDQEATHTKSDFNQLANRRISDLCIPLSHPPKLTFNNEIDRATLTNYYPWIERDRKYLPATIKKALHSLILSRLRRRYSQKVEDN